MNHRLLWQQIPSPIVTEILCRHCDTEKFKFTGVVLDTEHGVFSDETVYTCIQVATLSGKDCFVRVTHLDKKFVRMILDAGATGIIFSTIETEDQAGRIYEYCTYPPMGLRGQGLVRENAWGKKELGKHKPILVAQIETVKGVNNLHLQNFDKLFDFFLIGPYDLSASIGCVGDFENIYYKSCIKSIEEKIPKTQMGYHIVKDIEKQLFQNGYIEYPFLALSMDTLMIMEKSDEISEILSR